MNTSQTAPHEPRILTLVELSALDVRTYKSPKCDRIVQVVGLPCFCQAMCYEFDPSIALYTERPRRIQLGEGALELSFWTRHTNGKEQYVLIVLAAETQAAPEGQRRHRRVQQLLDAASKVGLELNFLFESDITTRTAEVAMAFRLLPFVQVARALPQRGVLRDAIGKAVGGWPNVRVSELQRALKEFNQSDVQAVVADMIHDGALRIDRNVPLSRSMSVSTGGGQ